MVCKDTILFRGEDAEKQIILNQSIPTENIKHCSRKIQKNHKTNNKIQILIIPLIKLSNRIANDTLLYVITS